MRTHRHHASIRPRRLGVQALFSCIAVALLAMSPLPASAAAPDLVLKDLSGKDRRVSEYIGRGRWVIVTVWSADCPICQREMYHMTFLHEEHKDKDIQVLGLSIDGYAQRAKIRDFVDDQSLNFPTLIGEPGDAGQLSGRPLLGTPTYFFFAPRGRFMTAHVGAMTQQQAEATIKRLRTR